MLPQAEFDKIAHRLKGVSKDGASIEAAQVKLIGLDEIREAAGPRWPRMRERVRTGSLGILSQHTGPDDVVIPCGDGFLIILAEGPAGNSQQRCQQMRDALLAFYLGEDALKNLRADVCSRSLSADGLTDLIVTSMHKEAHAAEAANTNTPPVVRVVARGRNNEIAHVRIFAVHEHKVGARICAPVLFERGMRRIGYNPEFILDGKHAKADFLELDIAVLDEALTTLGEAKAAGRAGALGISVHATTMQLRKARETYLSWLADIDPEMRRHLFVTIAEIEKGTPLISIAEWTSALRSQLGRVWLDFHYTDHAIASVGGAGAWAAGFHLPTFSGVQKGPRAQRMLDQIAFWTRSMHSQNLKLIVNGFQEADFLKEADALGVDFATSDALWPFEFHNQDLAAAG